MSVKSNVLCIYFKITLNVRAGHVNTEVPARLVHILTAASVGQHSQEETAKVTKCYCHHYFQHCADLGSCGWAKVSD